MKLFALSDPHLSFGTPVSVIRPFNTYGPRQSARAVIPAIVGQLLDGAETLRLGSLTPRRDLTYVVDTARAFVALATCAGAAGREVHVASGADVSIGELAAALVARVAPGTPVVTDEARLRPERAEVQRLCGDATRLRELTGWTPRWDLARGLDATVAWFREHRTRAGYQV